MGLRLPSEHIHELRLSRMSDHVYKNEFISFTIHECKLEGLVELGLRLLKKCYTQSMKPGANLKLSLKSVIISQSNTFNKGHMDQLIERLSSLVRKGNDLFQQERPVQYGVLGGYLVLWLLISGRLTQTLLVGLAMGLAWMVGTRKGD